MNKSIDMKFNRLFELATFHCFDQLSSINVLFDSLRPLINHHVLLTNEFIKITSLSLIERFITWYRTSPFHFITNFDLNQLVINDRWSNYIVLLIFYFLKVNYNNINFISYSKYIQRLFNYTQNKLVSSLSYRLFDQFFYFLSTFLNLPMTNTEFVLLSTLLIIQTGKIPILSKFISSCLCSLDQSTKTHRELLEILYTYEIHTFPSEQPTRFNRLIHFSEQIQSITQALIAHQHFYLPFLLLPN